jgi:hypothetical protein
MPFMMIFLEAQDMGGKAALRAGRAARHGASIPRLPYIC